MATTTTPNLNLVKPTLGTGEPADISVINGNMDIIDLAVVGKVSKSGDTMNGALNLKNNTWNSIGDDCYLGDNNTAGCIAIKGRSGATGIAFVPYSGSTTQTIKTDGNGNMTISGNISFPGLLYQTGANSRTGTNKLGCFHNAQGNGNTASYMRIARIVIDSSYVNIPISFITHERGRTVTKVEIGFSSVNSKDPGINFFNKNGSTPFYIVKVATSTWDLYFNKQEAWTNLLFYDLQLPYSAISITWYSENVTSLPSGYITATDKYTYASSDKRLKKNIEDLDSASATNFILSLKPSSFTLIDTENDSMGFIAQDIDMDNPYGNAIVKKPLDEENGFYEINYDAFIAPLTAALQDALKRIEELERDVSELKEKL